MQYFKNLKFMNKRKKVLLNKTVAFILVFGFLAAIPMSNGNSALGFWDGQMIFFATEARDEAQGELDDLENEIGDLEDQRDEVNAQLSEKAQALSELMADMELLGNDIATTQAAIDQAKMDLEIAKAEEEKAYQAMLIRIQYMYENSTQNSMWDAILGADGITDLLNRVEYVSQVHKTDRELLEEYKAVVVEVETLAAELQANMDSLVALQEAMEHQEVELENAMAALKEEAEDYSQQIAAAEEHAKELAAFIEEENQRIREEERKRKEEEERKRQEEEARKKQEEEEQKRQKEEAQNNQNNNSNSNSNAADSNSDNGSNSGTDNGSDGNSNSGTNNGSDGNSNSGTNNGSDGNSNSGTDNSSNSDSATDSSSSSKDPAFRTNISGEELVAYALQFVGNPYVWGGNSLTEGCDCSGFVNLVYSHFGFTNVPRYSQSFKTYGQAVSFENIKAGDIVVYPGHVAIYIGNGKIVEAQSTRAGITCTRSVTCSTITAIRRVL